MNKLITVLFVSLIVASATAANSNCFVLGVEGTVSFPPAGFTSVCCAVCCVCCCVAFVVVLRLLRCVCCWLFLLFVVCCFLLLFVVCVFICCGIMMGFAKCSVQVTLDLLQGHLVRRLLPNITLMESTLYLFLSFYFSLSISLFQFLSNFSLSISLFQFLSFNFSLSISLFQFLSFDFSLSISLFLFL
jgi:hypothetical protein